MLRFEVVRSVSKMIKLYVFHLLTRDQTWSTHAYKRKRIEIIRLTAKGVVIGIVGLTATMAETRAAGQEMTIAPVVRHRPVEKIVVGEMKLMVGMPMREHTNPMIMAVAGRGRLNVLADLDQMRAIAVDPRVHMVDHAKILNDWIFPDVMVKKSLTSSCCLCKKSSEISLTGFNVHSMIAG